MILILKCLKIFPSGKISVIFNLHTGGKTITKEYEEDIPIGRVGTREDIANTVLYVVSPAAQLLTGTTIIADGGSWLTSENSLRRIRKVIEMQSKMWDSYL